MTMGGWLAAERSDAPASRAPEAPASSDRDAGASLRSAASLPRYEVRILTNGLALFWPRRSDRPPLDTQAGRTVAAAIHGEDFTLLGRRLIDPGGVTARGRG